MLVTYLYFRTNAVTHWSSLRTYSNNHLYIITNYKYTVRCDEFM